MAVTWRVQWDKVEDKPTVLLYAGGAVLALWITSSVLGSLDRIPLVPDFLKLVGTLYSGWFVYRYLLFEVRHFSCSRNAAWDEMLCSVAATSTWQTSVLTCSVDHQSTVLGARTRLVLASVGTPL